MKDEEAGRRIVEHGHCRRREERNDPRDSARHSNNNNALNLAKWIPGLILAMTLSMHSAHAQPQPADSGADAYQTIYLTNITSPADANEIQTALRNMLPKAKLFYVPEQSAITIRGTSEDIALARKIVSDLDRNKKIYRLTYTIAESDGGKRVAQEHFSLIVASGNKSDLKQGTKVPIITGATDAAPGTQSSQVQYEDVGLEIEASLSTYLDGVKVLTKIAKSSVADEKSGIGVQDPVFRQTMLEGTSTLTPGKPLVLGSLDIPGSTRHQEVEVVAELIH